MSSISLILLGLLPFLISLSLDFFALIAFWFFRKNPPVHVVYPVDHFLSLLIPIYIFYNYQIKNHEQIFKDQFSSLSDTLKAFFLTFPVMMLFLFIYNYSTTIVANPIYKHTTIVFINFIFGSIAEEVLFRGVILKSFLERTTINNAILIVSFLSMSFHILMSRHLFYLFFIFIFNVIISISYLKGKLGASILNHILTNFVVNVFFI